MLTPQIHRRGERRGRHLSQPVPILFIIRIREIVSIGNVLRAYAIRPYKYIEEAFEEARADGHHLHQEAALFCVALP